jgi:hypothetical protein
MTAQQQAEEALRRTSPDGRVILSEMADRLTKVRPDGPMVDGRREALACRFSVELFGYGPRSEAAEREALRLAPRITAPITRGEYALQLRAAAKAA